MQRTDGNHPLASQRWRVASVQSGRIRDRWRILRGWSAEARNRSHPYATYGVLNSVSGIERRRRRDIGWKGAFGRGVPLVDRGGSRAGRGPGLRTRHGRPGLRRRSCRSTAARPHRIARRHGDERGCHRSERESAGAKFGFGLRAHAGCRDGGFSRRRPSGGSWRDERCHDRPTGRPGSDDRQLQPRFGGSFGAVRPLPDHQCQRDANRTEPARFFGPRHSWGDVGSRFEPQSWRLGAQPPAPRSGRGSGCGAGMDSGAAIWAVETIPRPSIGLAIRAADSCSASPLQA